MIPHLWEELNNHECAEHRLWGCLHCGCHIIHLSVFVNYFHAMILYMHYDYILKNGVLLTTFGPERADLGIVSGKIAKIGTIEGGKAGQAKEVIDCTDLHVLPGAIDMHVHFREPGATHKEDLASGSAAALSAGITTVADMPNNDPPIYTFEALAHKRQLVQEKAVCNVLLYMGFNGENLEEIKKAQAQGWRDFAGVKLYMSHSTGVEAAQNLEAIEDLLQLGLFIIVHSEDERIIRQHMDTYKEDEDPSVHSLINSPESAFEATRKILHLAKKYGTRLHITHVSTKAEADEIAKFKSGGMITADATPHHLFLNETAYASLENFVKMNPPLRHEADREGLWEALRTGTIDCVATDHAPHTRAEKEVPYSQAPAGVPGVETMLPLLLNAVTHGELNLQDVVRITSKKPADILALPNKGRIEEGADADLVIVDMNLTKKVGADGYKSKCGWSPFEGKELTGWPVRAILS